MADHLRLANPSDSPPIRRVSGEFVSTPTAQRIMRSLAELSQKRGVTMAMIAGVPGCGKTMALRRFREEDGEELSFTFSAVAGEGKPTGVAEVVYRAITGGNSNGKSLARIRTELACDTELSLGLTLIVDEAQALEPEGAEWLRGLVEQASGKLVLAGDLALLSLRSKLPQLARRIPRPVVIDAVTAEDVAALVQGTVFATPEAIRLLTFPARRIGGLADVQLLLDDAHDIAVAAGEVPAMAHLKFALEDYGQARKGVWK